MAIEINISGDFRRHADHDASNWNRTLYLVPGPVPYVFLDETYGNGTPEPAWNGRWLYLGSLPQNVADASGVQAYLETAEAQRILSDFLASYLCDWDGQRLVGAWGGNSDEFLLLEYLPETWPALQRALDDCPTFWDADDWFVNGGWPDGLDAATSDEDLDLLAEEAVGGAKVEGYWIDFENAKVVLARRREYLRERCGWNAEFSHHLAGTALAARDRRLAKECVLEAATGGWDWGRYDSAEAAWEDYLQSDDSDLATNRDDLFACDLEEVEAHVRMEWAARHAPLTNNQEG